MQSVAYVLVRGLFGVATVPTSKLVKALVRALQPASTTARLIPCGGIDR
jgi:hypothetical protein